MLLEPCYRVVSWILEYSRRGKVRALHKQQAMTHRSQGESKPQHTSRSLYFRRPVR
jgi:hypothetical protein